MKKQLVILLILLILLSSAVTTHAELSGATFEKRYSGTWVADDYTLVLEYKDNEMTGKLTHDEESGDIVIWEFNHCEYYSGEDYLWCPSCIHYREHIDFNTFERTEEDWWLTDMSDIYFAFGGDEYTLIGYEIDDLNEPLTLKLALVPHL